MEIRRIKLKEFLCMDIINGNDYVFAIRYSKEFNEPEDFYKIGDIGELPYGLIKDLITDLESNELNFKSQIEYLQKINDKIDWNEQYLDLVCRELTYLIVQISELIERENELLSSKPSFEEQQADVDRFADIGTYMQIRELANNDVTKIEAVRNTSYNTCLLELYARKTMNDFERDLRKIYELKSK